MVRIQDEEVPHGARAAGRDARVGARRRAAQAHLVGLGTVRSVRAAYFWAGMAAAAGDSSAMSIRAGLEARMDALGLARSWRDIAAGIDGDVLDTWMAADLPARLGGN